jgi:hypothetical protein
MPLRLHRLQEVEMETAKAAVSPCKTLHSFPAILRRQQVDAPLQQLQLLPVQHLVPVQLSFRILSPLLQVPETASKAPRSLLGFWVLLSFKYFDMKGFAYNCFL